MTTLKSRIHLSGDTLFSDLNGETVILNMKNDKYQGLDEVGTRAWTLFKQHGHMERVYQTLLQEYDVSGEKLQKDLLQLVDQLASHGLVEVDAA